MPVQIITDSVASIPKSDAAALGIEVVSLFVNDGTETFIDSEIDPDAFYLRLADMAHLPTSSQPSVESLVSAFSSAVNRGADVLGVFISEKMSGTIETARMAASMVLEQAPHARIEIVDSRSNSMEEGLAAESAAYAAQQGASLDQCVHAAIETTKRTRYVFAPESLEYLRRGGRIGTASALLGSLLDIKPILTVRNGQTEVLAKVRSHTKALSEMARTFTNDVHSHGLRNVVVHYIGERAPAERFAAEHIVPTAGAPVRILPVSPVIGVHVGPAVALVYETESELSAK